MEGSIMTQSERREYLIQYLLKEDLHPIAAQYIFGR